MYDSFLFAGIKVQKIGDKYLMSQERYAEEPKVLNMDCMYEQFRGRRHEVAGLAHTTPDLCAAVAILSRVTINKFSRKHFTMIKEVIRKADETSKQRLWRHKLDKL